MARHFAGRAPAFTRRDLIALLVVLGVLGLLASCLLPSPHRRPESRRVVKCLSNMRCLMQATYLYLNDSNCELPFIVRGRDGTTELCPWSYGGSTSDDYWKTRDNGLFFITALERPMNTYLLGRPPEPDLITTSGEVRRYKMILLQCPEERGTHQRGHAVGPKDPHRDLTCYDDVGTSYLLNLHAFGVRSPAGTDRRAELRKADAKDWDPWADDCAGWSNAGRTLIRDVLARHAETFASFVEAPMDFGLTNAVSVVGNHGGFERNAVGFLDGHAVLLPTDTRRKCGTHWTAINPDWIRRPGPALPPYYYTTSHRSCEAKPGGR